LGASACSHGAHTDCRRVAPGVVSPCRRLHLERTVPDRVPAERVDHVSQTGVASRGIARCHAAAASPTNDAGKPLTPESTHPLAPTGVLLGLSLESPYRERSRGSRVSKRTSPRRTSTASRRTACASPRRTSRCRSAAQVWRAFTPPRRARPPAARRTGEWCVWRDGRSAGRASPCRWWSRSRAARGAGPSPARRFSSRGCR